MVISPLQRYILRAGLTSRHAVPRSVCLGFYRGRTKVPRPKDQVDAVTKSIERLITRGLVVGYGEKTAERLFITSIKITPAGRRLARASFGRQQKLHL
ncbi:MAG: hypothetical protein AAB817_00070 [Patescibacteria group bacterium]